MPTDSKPIDCAVIGAGVVGLLIADELLTHGLKVCILDRQTPGREASWAGAGILPPGSGFSDHACLEELARLSRPLQAALSDRIREQTGIDDGYWRCGGVYLAPHQIESDKLDSMTARWRSLGIPSERIDARAVATYLPEATPEVLELADRFSAYRVPDEIQIRNPRLLKGIVQLCKRSGAMFQLDAGVADLRETERGVEIVTENGDELFAQRAVVAAGAWSTPLLSRFTSIRVKPMRGQMVLLESNTGQPPITTHVHSGPNYLVPRRDGRLIAGSTVEDAGFDKSTNADGLAEVVRFVRDAGLGHLRIAQTWAGLRPACTDGLPLIGRARGSERVFFATGHFRAGLQFAPATAMLVREMLLGQLTSMDPEPFRVDR